MCHWELLLEWMLLENLRPLGATRMQYAEEKNNLSKQTAMINIIIIQDSVSHANPSPVQLTSVQWRANVLPDTVNEIAFQ